MTSFLSTGELAQLRADALATLADATCTILTPTATVDSIGEPIIAWGTVATGVACRLRPSGQGASLRVQYGGIFPTPGQSYTVAPWTVTLPYGQAVSPGDRIVVAAVVYEVIQSWSSESWATSTRVDVKCLET